MGKLRAGEGLAETTQPWPWSVGRPDTHFHSRHQPPGPQRLGARSLWSTGPGQKARDQGCGPKGGGWAGGNQPLLEQGGQREGFRRKRTTRRPVDWAHLASCRLWLLPAHGERRGHVTFHAPARHADPGHSNTPQTPLWVPLATGVLLPQLPGLSVALGCHLQGAAASRAQAGPQGQVLGKGRRWQRCALSSHLIYSQDVPESLLQPGQCQAPGPSGVLALLPKMLHGAPGQTHR